MEKNDRDYSNDEITVHWRPSECIHSTICYTKLRKVFDPARRPWVKMDGAETNQIIEIVKECPTDALTFSWNNESGATDEDKNTDKHISDENITKIQVMKDGPIIINGKIYLTGPDGNKLASGDTTVLCKCGLSKNQPYCDGSHND